MRRLGTAAALMCVLCIRPGGSGAQDARAEHVLEPTVMVESFAGDSLGQWASYPPAQDVGYETDPAFSRAFRREFGVPPAAWRGAHGTRGRASARKRLRPGKGSAAGGFGSDVGDDAR